MKARTDRTGLMIVSWLVIAFWVAIGTLFWSCMHTATVKPVEIHHAWTQQDLLCAHYLANKQRNAYRRECAEFNQRGKA